MSWLKGVKPTVIIRRYEVSLEDNSCYLILYKYEIHFIAGQVSYLD